MPDGDVEAGDEVCGPLEAVTVAEPVGSEELEVIVLLERMD